MYDYVKITYYVAAYCRILLQIATGRGYMTTT